MRFLCHSFESTRRLYEDTLSKFGSDSKEFDAIDSNILEIFSRLLCWIRGEGGFDRIFKTTMSVRIKSLIRVIDTYIRSFFIDEADVVFFPTSETHLAQQFPVADYLARQRINVLFVTNKSAVIKKIPSRFPSFFISVLINPFRFGPFRVQLADFPFSWQFISPLISKSEVLRWANRCILRRARPRCVVLGNDLSLEGRVAGKEFLADGLLVTTIQHGGVDNPMHCFSFSEIFFVFGSQSKKILLERGAKAKDVVVTGAPYLSSIRNRIFALEDLLPKFGINPKNKKRLMLVLLSGPGHSMSQKNNQRIVNFLQAFVSVRQEICCVLKLHKKDRHHNYEGLTTNENNLNPICILSNNDLERCDLTVFDLIQNAFCIASAASTSVLEAMYLKKTIFTFDFSNEYSSIDFIRSGGSIHLTDEDDAFNTLDSFFRNQLDTKGVLERAEKFISSYFYRSEISPSELISQHLMSSLGRKHMH